MPAGPTMVQLSDLHLGQKGRGHEDAFRRLCAWLVELGPDVVAVTGDIAHIPGDDAAFAVARDHLDATGLRWFAIPGNHDIPSPYPEPSDFDAFFGPTPRVESAAGAVFFLFDTFRTLPVEQRSRAEQERGAGHYSHGAIGPDQFRRMTELLRDAPAGRRIALIHHHLHPHRHEIGRDAPTAEDREQMRPLYDVDRFLDWCHDHNIELILSGHQHAWTPPEVVDGIPNVRGTRCTRPAGVAREISLNDPIVVRDWRLAEPGDTVGDD